MFKKENIIDELIESMQKNFAYISSFEERNKNDRLKKAHNYVLSASNIFNKFAINQESINDYNSAIDLLNSAIEIYDDYGLKSKSDEILFLLEKIGNSEQIIENYKSTGTAFNYNVDDNKLNIEDSELSENSDNSFEDEP